MLKVFLAFFTLIFGFEQGWSYLHSQKFFDYASAKKEPWTCQVSYYLGRFHDMTGDEKIARDFYGRTVSWCKDSPIAIEATFKIAETYDQAGLLPTATDLYTSFIEKYPQHPLVVNAQDALARIKGAKGL